MKRLGKSSLVFLIILSVLCVFSACHIEFTGTSAVFSDEDLQSAADVVYRNNKEMHDIKTVCSVKYAGDDAQTDENDAYCRSLDKSIDEYIVFETSFFTGRNTQVFDENRLYTGWTYYLGREHNGSWRILTCGYG